MVADLNRNYTFATDPVCELLGYDRAMLLELRIDDIVDGSTHVAAPLFQRICCRRNADRKNYPAASLRQEDSSEVFSRG